jgi:DNA-binding NtrC family response regulator
MLRDGDGRPEYHLTESAMALLKSHHFRGNIRELRNILSRAMVLSNTNVIDQGVIHQALDTGSVARREPAAEVEELSLKAAERRYLESLMERHGGDRETVAAIAQISVRSLYRKLQEGTG